MSLSYNGHATVGNEQREGHEQKTHKLQSVRAGIRPHKLVNAAPFHPLRYHHEPGLGHSHT